MLHKSSSLLDAIVPAESSIQESSRRRPGSRRKLHRGLRRDDGWTPAVAGETEGTARPTVLRLHLRPEGTRDVSRAFQARKRLILQHRGFVFELFPELVLEHLP